MNTYTYHKDIRTILAAVGNVFGGMTISRMVGNEENSTFDNITIPVVFAPKTRTLNELVNTSKHIKLPIMCYELKSVQYDQQRNFNKLDGYLVANKVDWTNTIHPMPLPVRMSLAASFICRFQEDYHQYITCLFTYFAPYVEISYKHPDLDVEVRCRVIWDGNATVNIPEQFNSTDPYRATIDSTFTVESWLFKNDNKKVNIIYNIPVNFSALADLSGPQSFLAEQREIGVNTDARIKEGRPLVWYTSTETVDVGNPDSEILIKGDMFTTVKGVAIVDMDDEDGGEKEKMYPEEMYKHYSMDLDKGYFTCDETTKHDETKAYFKYDDQGNKDDKTHYVPFDGVPAEFEIIDEHKLLVKIPVAERGGRFDVYVIGKCGYGKLSEDHERAYRIHPLHNTKGIEGVYISRLEEYVPEEIAGDLNG